MGIPEAEELFAEANDLADTGKFQRAIEAYDRALQTDPGFAAAWCNRGAVLWRVGSLEDALVSFERCLAADPLDDRAWSNKGSVLSELGRSLESLIAFDAGIEANPRNGETWKNKGAVLIRLERLDEARACLERAHHLGDPSAARLLAVTLGKLGLPEEAMRWFDVALEVDPNDAESWKNRGIVLLGLGRLSEGMECLSRAGELGEPVPLEVLQAFTNPVDRMRAALHQFIRGVRGSRH